MRHTEANIGWHYPYIHPLRLLEYLGVQFGVFGPILLVVLARAAWRENRAPTDPNKRLLLSFSLPVLALLAVQALLSRAHGNWSATAYPAASILVTAVMLELNRLILFRLSLALHLAVAVELAAASAFARQWPVFERLQFLSSAVGWREAGDAVHARLGQDRYGAIVVDTRELAAELLYYLRGSGADLCLAVGTASVPSLRIDAALHGVDAEPILYVSLRRCPDRFQDLFATVDELGTQSVPVVKHEARVLHFCRLAGYRPSAASNAP